MQRSSWLLDIIPIDEPVSYSKYTQVMGIGTPCISLVLRATATEFSASLVCHGLAWGDTICSHAAEACTWATRIALALQLAANAAVPNARSFVSKRGHIQYLRFLRVRGRIRKDTLPHRRCPCTT